MNEETLTDALLREFLLGKGSDEERERIENLFLTDSQARERVLGAEQDLIEDYLDDSLTPADKERFVSLYAQTDEQRRKLRITKSIMDWAVAEAPVPQPIPVEGSFWSRLFGWLRVNPMVIPVAATVMIAIVVVAVWLASRTTPYSAIERELARLNTPASMREALPQMIAKDLSPGAVRGIEQQVEIKRDGVQFVELRLSWRQRERYAKYEAKIQRVGNDESYKIPDLQALDDSPTIRIRLPTHILERGHYQVDLIGIEADGSAGLSDEYTFAVEN